MSLATGALLVPLSAYGASSLVNAPAEPEPASTSTTVAPVASPTETVAPVESADIGIACGEQGMQLVATEVNGSISTVQQAALDALRDICADEGMPLPDTTLAPATTPTTVAVQPTTVGTSPDEDGDDRDDDHSGHGRHGDDEDDEHDDRDDEDDN
jgi:hypothetical protein